MTPEEMIANRYKVLDTLGQGGMATVYLANDEQLNRLVAIKMLLLRDLTDGQAIRFQNEAKAIGRLNHSAIMAALDFGVTKDGQPFLVLEHKRGTTLDTILDENGRLEVSEALLIASRICEGLAYAHKAGILHRDIKPSNIYITDSESPRDSVKILDFGIAKFQSNQPDDSTADATPDHSQYFTKAGTVIGSPTYMSPEQARGERVDERADVYSLGCVLFEMLTGQPPIKGKSAVETLAKKTSESAPTLASQAPDAGFSKALETIVARSLEMDRSKRYSKASEMLADLESQISESTLEPAQSESIEPTDGGTAQTSDAQQKVFTVTLVLILLVVLNGSTMAYFIFARTVPEKVEVQKTKEKPVALDSEMANVLEGDVL
jgi:Serine/threonine protein kinase